MYVYIRHRASGTRGVWLFILRNTPPRLPVGEVDFQGKSLSLSPPVPESSNPENIKKPMLRSLL